MPPRSRAEFADLFRSLPAPDRARFVATLWADRGWETTVVGETIRAQRDDVVRRIRVVDPGRFGTPSVDDVDTLVVARDRDRVREAAQAAGVEYRTSDDVRDRLLYGLDRETGSARFAEFFDRPLVVDAAPDEDASADAGVTVRSLTLPSASALRVALVVLLVVAAGVNIAGPGVFGPSTQSAAGNNALGTFTPGEAGAVGGETSSATATPTNGGYPPGLSEAGVTNATLLADRHLARTLNFRYELSVAFRGPAAAPGFGDWEEAQWFLTVESKRAYRLEAQFNRTGPDGQADWGTRKTYANGVSDYRIYREPNSTRMNEAPASSSDSDSYAYFGAGVVRNYLNTSESTVECAVEVETGCRIYRIVATGDPRSLSPEAENASIEGYRAQALVTDEGRLTDLTVVYEIHQDGDVDRARLWLRYAEYRTATVERPAWLSRFEDGDGTTPTPAGTDNATATETAAG